MVVTRGKGIALPAALQPRKKQAAKASQVVCDNAVPSTSQVPDGHAPDGQSSSDQHDMYTDTPIVSAVADNQTVASRKPVQKKGKAKSVPVVRQAKKQPVADVTSSDSDAEDSVTPSQGNTDDVVSDYAKKHPKKQKTCSEAFSCL